MWSSPASTSDLQPRFGQADARSDEIGIKPCGARARDEFREIGPRQRFPSGKVRVQHAQLAALLENIDPLFCGKLRMNRSQLEGIGAVDAMQRAAVRDLGDEG